MLYKEVLRRRIASFDMHKSDKPGAFGNLANVCSRVTRAGRPSGPCAVRQSGVSKPRNSIGTREIYKVSIIS